MLKVRPSLGLALILFGWALLSVGVALESSIALAGGFLGPGGLRESPAHLLFVPWALGFVFAGYALDHPEVLWGRGNGSRVAATYLLFLDGAIHTLAIGEHIDLPVVIFFVVLAPLQWIGAFYILRGSPRYLAVWMYGSIGLILLYVASRTVTLPFVTQNLYYVVQPLGLLSKTVEVLLVASLAKALWTSRATTRPTEARSPSMRG